MEMLYEVSWMCPESRRWLVRPYKLWSLASAAGVASTTADRYQTIARVRWAKGLDPERYVVLQAYGSAGHRLVFPIAQAIAYAAVHRLAYGDGFHSGARQIQTMIATPKLRLRRVAKPSGEVA